MGMIEKYAFDALLSKISHGAVKVKYWDGTTTSYGKGKPYFTMSVTSPRAIRAIFKDMSKGFGESYMDKLIEIEGPLTNVGRIVSENTQVFDKLTFTKLARRLTSNTFGTQKQHIQHHYDLGNDFYKLWLDKSMTYSCAYFRQPNDSLEQAQSQKIHYILKKMQLQRGMTLLDIGSGWGELLAEAVKLYGVKGHGITLSKEQYEYSVARAKKEGLGESLTFELIGFNELAQKNITFDRIVSVGMYEHVGVKNQKIYFEAVKKMLKMNGISMLHTITIPQETPPDPWIDKYIFPGGYLPSTSEVVKWVFNSGFDLIDYENLRVHYAKTLDEWLNRYEQHKAEIIKKYGEKFYRMWRLYLASSSAGFRYGDLKLSQYVFTNHGNNNLPLTREFIYN
jgi:cyclopropane-fatty-acyl-phospholipid synthase